MKKLLSYLFIMFIGCSVYGQKVYRNAEEVNIGDPAGVVVKYKDKKGKLRIDTIGKEKVYYGIAGVKKEPIDSSKIFWRLYVKNKQRGIPDSLNKYYIKLKK